VVIRRILLACLAFLYWGCAAASALAAPWPSLLFEQSASGFEQPVHLTGARDASGRLFVVERPGRIRIVRASVVLPTPFLDISARVLSAGGEQGLLSVAFPADFATTRRFYVDYTAAGGGAAGHTVVSRFGLLSDDSADPDSEEVLLTVDQPYANHNGGQLAFGPDGFLYVGLGDGGSAGDPGRRAQSKNSRLGKLLRIDAANSTPGNLVLPAANPFVGRPGDDAVWAYGLRNPWRFSFDRGTGDLYIGDVGQNAWEEVDFQAAGSPGGSNYGWRRLEGRHPYPPGSAFPAFRSTLPVAEYRHGANDANGCSIIGGFVYRGADFPALQGLYYFGDLCTGKVWGLQRLAGRWRKALLADTPFKLTTFGEGDAGELFLADYATGTVYQVRAP
jgi:glucose/arabinose dehydrogenase